MNKQDLKPCDKCGTELCKHPFDTIKNLEKLLGRSISNEKYERERADKLELRLYRLGYNR